MTTPDRPCLPDPVAAARLTKAMEALGRGDVGDRWLVAVSGGVDSMALLTLSAGAGRSDTVAVTIDHGLRPGSADEAAMVARHARALGLRHETVRLSLAGGANLQHRARVARYAALEEARRRCGARWILTAHHGDDQLETIAMRLARGSGVHGLAGIRAVNGPVTRPLLGWRRRDLHRVAMDTATPWSEDPSNRDDRYDRSRWRRHVAHLPIAADRLERSTRACAEAADALDWAVDRLIAGWAPQMVGPWPPDTPAALRRLSLMRVLSALDPAPRADGVAVDRLLGAMTDGSPASIGDWMLRPVPSADASRTLFRLVPAPSRSGSKAREPAGACALR